MASRCTTALVDPPMAASVTMALWKDARVTTWEMVLPSAPAPRRADRTRAPFQQPAVRRRRAGQSRDRHAERLGHDAHARGGAHGVAVAPAADHRRLGPRNSSDDRVPAGPPRSAARRRCRSPAAAPGRFRSASAHPRSRRPGGRHWPPPSTARGLSCRSRRAARVRRWGWRGTSPPSPSPPCSARAWRWAGPGSPRGRRPGGSTGCRPPRTPCFTASATSLRWELQGVRSEAVLAIAICGRPRRRWTARRAASRPGGGRRCDRPRRTTPRYATSHQHAFLLPTGCDRPVTAEDRAADTGAQLGVGLVHLGERAAAADQLVEGSRPAR